MGSGNRFDSRKKAKVCILSSVHDADDSRIFYKQAFGLRDAGYDVSYIVQHPREETLNGIRIVPLPAPKNRLSRMFGTVWSLYRKADRERADVYHFHDPELIPVGLLLKLRGKKVIYDVHEDVPKQILAKHWIVKPLRRTVAWLVNRLEYFAAKQYDAVVTATSTIEQRFVHRAKRTLTVHNYPIAEEFAAIDPDGRKEHAVCFIGGISKVRGIMQMVEAVELAGINLVIAGPTRIAADREEAAKLPGWTRVEELGHVERPAVHRVLARSIAGLVVEHPIPNYLDALPIKMFEYMAAGLPVIASNFPVWRAIVEGNDCGICVDPLDSRLVAAAIAKLTADPEAAREMGRSGRRAILQKYGWETQKVLLLRLYEQLLGTETAPVETVNGVTLAE